MMRACVFCARNCAQSAGPVPIKIPTRVLRAHWQPQIRLCAPAVPSLACIANVGARASSHQESAASRIAAFAHAQAAAARARACAAACGVQRAPWLSAAICHHLRCADACAPPL
eukprot:6174703-Pleurochrysis_carterae.AAC.2